MALGRWARDRSWRILTASLLSVCYPWGHEKPRIETRLGVYDVTTSAFPFFHSLGQRLDCHESLTNNNSWMSFQGPAVEAPQVCALPGPSLHLVQAQS